jgi:ankyrin repeat protein
MFRFNSFPQPQTSTVTLTHNEICDLLSHDNTKAVLDEIEKNKNFKINEQDTRTKNTLLHIAIKERNVKVIEVLINKGADINIKNRKGESCGDLLALSGLGQIIHTIVDSMVNKSKSQYVYTEKELNDSRDKNKLLEQNIKTYMDSNIRITKQKQDLEYKYGSLEVDVITLRKRKLDLDDKCVKLEDKCFKLEDKCFKLEKDLIDVTSSRDNLIKASKKQRT